MANALTTETMVEIRRLLENHTLEREVLHGVAGPLLSGELLKASDYTLTLISEVVDAWETRRTKVVLSTEGRKAHGLD